MAYISKEERDKIPDEDYGIPDRKLYPIRNQQDLDDAAHLIGKHPEAKKRIIGIAKRKKLRLPQSWAGPDDAQPVLTSRHGTPDGIGGNSDYYREQRAKMSAQFSISQDGRKEDGDFALYTNRVIFEAGDYSKTHGITISPEELQAAEDRFKPVWGNIEHTDFAQGRAVGLDAVRVDSEDPWKLRGDVRIPRLLDEFLTDKEKKVSCEWNMQHKTLDGIALVVHPHIPSADLTAQFAAFAKKHSSPHGKRMMQTIHDIASTSGAYCMDPKGDTDNVNASFIMRHERGAFQKIHDHAVEHGADCPGGSRPYFSLASATSKGKPMSLLAKLTRLFGSAKAEDAPTDAEITAVFTALQSAENAVDKPTESAIDKPDDATADFAKNAEFVAMKARADAMEKQNAEFAARLVQADAEKWADAVIAAKQALITERDTMLALYKQAIQDDAADGAVARFSDTTKALGANRVEAMKKVYANRPRHYLYNEVLPDAIDGEPTYIQVSSTFSGKRRDGKDAPDPKEVDELRGYSTMLSTAKKATS